MLFEVSSSKTLEAIDRGLRASAAQHQFGVIEVHNLKEIMAKKGVEFNGECLIYEVCNPHQAKKVLEANGAVSAALPCRISVYSKGQAYKLATILPTAMMEMFGDPTLAPVAREVETVVVAMMQEAASSTA
ncbi:MAG: hypothetical protein H6Q86_614 [candidate division NC10 bacterium]|nr:hypothetical protein [candidate division NC10 bacterium]